MEKFKNVEKDVEELLKSVPDTREDDMLLYWLYCLKKGIVGPAQFMNVFANKNFREEHNISVFESISRARRKLQSENLSLKPSEKVEEARKEKEEKVKEWVRGNDEK